MAGIKDVYTSVMQQVSNIPDFQFVRIWNNQIQQLEDGETYAFPFPCCFVEIQAPTDYLPIMRGYSVSDLLIRIHIGQIEYDAGDGTMEQNVSIFALRDKIITQLTNKQPTACSSLMKVREYQDFEHTNVYHYVVEFICSFVDDKGSLENQVPFIETILEDVIVEPQVVPYIYSNFDFTFDNTF